MLIVKFLFVGSFAHHGIFSYKTRVGNSQKFGRKFLVAKGCLNRSDACIFTAANKRQVFPTFIFSLTLV